MENFATTSLPAPVTFSNWCGFGNPWAAFSTKRTIASPLNDTLHGQEDEFLGDSNLDWGWDLARLGRRAPQHGLKTFSRANLDPYHRELPA